MSLWPGAIQADDMPPLHSESPPSFTADMVISADPQGRPSVAATISIPYGEVQWIRIPPAERRAAHVEVSISIQGRRRDPLHGDLWERRVVVPSFAASRSPNAALTDRRVFHLPPGRHEVRVTVRDLNGGLES